jgi:hypothetical protein
LYFPPPPPPPLLTCMPVGGGRLEGALPGGGACALACVLLDVRVLRRARDAGRWVLGAGRWALGTARQEAPCC